eukprot:Gb_20004 [translate_table: standard]
MAFALCMTSESGIDFRWVRRFQILTLWSFGLSSMQPRDVCLLTTNATTASGYFQTLGGFFTRCIITPSERKSLNSNSSNAMASEFPSGKSLATSLQLVQD